MAGPASYFLPTPFTQVCFPHSSSQIFTNPLQIIITYPHIFSPYLLSHHILLGSACHSGWSRHIPSFHSSYNNLPPFTHPHRSSQIPILLFYLTGPACHCGRSRLIPSPHSSLFIINKLFSLPLLILTGPIQTFTDPHILPLLFCRPGLSLWQVPPTLLLPSI